MQANGAPLLALSVLTGLATTAFVVVSARFAIRKFAGPIPRNGMITLVGASALMVASAFTVMPNEFLVAVTIGLGWTLIVLGAVDFATFRLPDLLTLPLAAAGVAVSWTLPGRPIEWHIVAGLGVYCILAGLAWAFRRFRGREAMGLGDAKLAAAAGAWLGIVDLPYTIVLACMGAFLWIGLRTLRRGSAALVEQIPFGAPLSLAIWIVWLYGSFLPGA